MLHIDQNTTQLDLVPDRFLRRVTRVLVGIWCAVAVAQLLSVLLRYGTGRDNVLGVVPMLNLNEESSLGTWVAAMVLMTCALLALACAATAHLHDVRWRRNWLLLAAVFLLMSVEEVAAVHDRMSPSLTGALGTSGVLYFAWVIPALLFAALFLAVQLRFLRALGRTGRDLVLAGAVYVTGAAGFEMAQGVFRDDGGNGSPYDVFPTIEELMEFAGTMLVLRVLLRHLLGVLPRDVVLRLVR